MLYVKYLITFYLMVSPLDTSYWSQAEICGSHFLGKIGSIFIEDPFKSESEKKKQTVCPFLPWQGHKHTITYNLALFKLDYKKTTLFHYRWHPCLSLTHKYTHAQLQKFDLLFPEKEMLALLACIFIKYVSVLRNWQGTDEQQPIWNGLYFSVFVVLVVL